MMTNTWPGWQCVEQLGEGSYGKVFRICREDFGRTYEAALKVITIPKSKSELESAYAEGMDEKSVTTYFYSFVEDIVAEFALMSQVKGNTNIVSYEDHMVVQHEDGIGWDILIRMELLTPLLAYAQKNPLKEEDVVRLGIDMARALKLCRKKGILHRDIKPENIFVNEDGDFKLGDFGVARITEKTVSAMSQKGTYIYMAPEVYKGEAYGYSADLYSLGLVLYRFLNDNRMPFMPPAPQAIKYSDREKAMNARMMNQPMSAPAHGSAQLQAIVLKVCAYDPADRFDGPEELERALLQLESGAAAVTKPAAQPEEDDDEDDFDKTISSFASYQPRKKTAPAEPAAPVMQEAESSWGQPVEDDDDYEEDFDKTVSGFGSYHPRKKTAMPVEPVVQEENDWGQPVEDDEEDEFDKTVSGFGAYQPKKTVTSKSEPKPAPEPTPESKPVPTPTPTPAPVPETKDKKAEKKTANKEKKSSGKGVKIAIALAVSVAVGMVLPPVGIGLAALSLVFILTRP